MCPLCVCSPIRRLHTHHTHTTRAHDARSGGHHKMNEAGPSRDTHPPGHYARRCRAPHCIARARRERDCGRLAISTTRGALGHPRSRATAGCRWRAAAEHAQQGSAGRKRRVVRVAARAQQRQASPACGSARACSAGCRDRSGAGAATHTREMSRAWGCGQRVGQKNAPPEGARSMGPSYSKGPSEGAYPFQQVDAGVEKHPSLAVVACAGRSQRAPQPPTHSRFV